MKKYTASLLCFALLGAATLLAADSNLITVANRGRFVEVRAQMPPNSEFVMQLDALYSNTSRVLGFTPKNIGLIVEIYRTDSELEDFYGSTLPVGHKAFFSAKNNRIYVSLPSVLDGVLAHEIAHALIFKAIGAKGTIEMHEILAKYAEYKVTRGIK